MKPDIGEVVRAAVERLQASGQSQPKVAIILGSGLGGLSRLLDNRSEVATETIPGYPPSTVQGHSGTFVQGTLNGVPVIVLSGRIHGYEGHPPAVVGIPARVLCRLKPEALVITNAAGGLRPDLQPGDLMLIADHLNLTGRSPLEGPNDETLGPRFPSMLSVYAKGLRDLAREAALACNRNLREGIYACVPGPQYETAAEVRMLRSLGADAVGMSTVPEAIVAAHMGVPVLGCSVITNAAAGLSDTPPSHEEVLAASLTAADDLGAILTRFIGLVTRHPNQPC